MKTFRKQNRDDKKFTVMSLFIFSILIGVLLALYKGMLLGNSIVGFIMLFILNANILGKDSIQLINKFNRLTESKLPSIIFTNIMASINSFMIFDIVVNNMYDIWTICPFIFIIIVAIYSIIKILKAIDTMDRL